MNKVKKILQIYDNNIKYIFDNVITMIRGLVYKFIFIIAFALFSSCLALEKIGIITDSMLSSVNNYNAYFKTPEFFAQDIRHALYQKNVQVVSLDTTVNALKRNKVTQKDLEALSSLQQGYNLEYPLLKKIARGIGVKKLVVVTMGMDIQRDFLKNTIWNIVNYPGNDVVNPTHRVSVYVSYVDTAKEMVLWESIYAKNIRNNKFKNLDTTVSNNYEGMLRLKEYSRYISPDIAYNVKMKTINPNYVEPPTYITRENVKQYVKDKHNIGTKKELSEIERQKWDTEKLIEDTKDNIKDKTDKAITHTKSGFGKIKAHSQSGFNKVKGFIKGKNRKIKEKELL